MDIEEIKKRIIPILNKHAIRKAGIFGSYVRQQESQESDIDLLLNWAKRSVCWILPVLNWNWKMR